MPPLDIWRWNSLWALLVGTLWHTAQTFFYWVYDRTRLGRLAFCTTAEFTKGDPSYDWVFHFLAEQKAWHNSRLFKVKQRGRKSKWTVKYEEGGAEYVPSYDEKHLLRWNGYFVDIKRVEHHSIYTWDLGVMSQFVEAARERYKEATRNTVTVHSAREVRQASTSWCPAFSLTLPPQSRHRLKWASTTSKALRPLSSIVLKEGLMESLVGDIREFLDSEEWYRGAGIPYRRGYLLHGPPGTGKTSTIYALAGELGLSIYTVPLSSSFVDDSYLLRAVSSMSRKSILLIEDIDCAFPSRSREDEDDVKPGAPPPDFLEFNNAKGVSLSGLLNVIDGIGSEEGGVFFATTNYVDRLDAALLRPGRIDTKIEYTYATKSQAEALFNRFFGREKTRRELKLDEDAVARLAAQFAAEVPEGELSVAEMQGLLLTYKNNPTRAMEEVGGWVAQMSKEREIRLDGKKLETLYNQPEVQTIEPDDFIRIDLPELKPPVIGNPFGGPHDVHLNPGVDINKFLEDTQITGDVLGPTHVVADLSPEKLRELTLKPNPCVRLIKYNPPCNHQRISLPEGLVLEFMQEN
ncbi:hypothetical protein H0H92_010179 [Tricholoma furcatifolium]|nr:hypothetical protein H0H92_010179 [Tricholoma furcatifolium]